MAQGRSSVGRGAIGVLSDGGRYLMVRRAEAVAKGGFWCFPGGHVEPGETPRDAVCRELAEELGIEVVAYQRLGAVRVPEPQYILAVWRVRLPGGELRPNGDEIADTGWFTADEARRLKPILPSNEHVFELLRSSGNQA